MAKRGGDVADIAGLVVESARVAGRCEECHASIALAEDLSD